MAKHREEFEPLRVDLDSHDPHDRQYAMCEYHSRNTRLEVVERIRKTFACPQNPSWHATYCDGCRKHKPGHFNHQVLQEEAETLQKDIRKLQCFLRGLENKQDCTT